MTACPVESERPWFEYIPEVEDRYRTLEDANGIVIAEACPTIFREATTSIAMGEAIEDQGGRLFGNPHVVWRYVLENGVAMKYEAPPPEFPDGEVKMCYMNATNVMDDFGLTYVEGFAYAGLVVAQHAWVTFAESDRAIDTTWKPSPLRSLGPERWEYLGVPFQDRFVREAIVEKGTFGVLDYGKVYE